MSVDAVSTEAGKFDSCAGKPGSSPGTPQPENAQNESIAAYKGTIAKYVTIKTQNDSHMNNIVEYTLEYDYDTIAEVTIDHNNPKSFEAIKETVEFWTNWERRLDEEDGDYIRVWLKNLTEFIISEDRLPCSGGFGAPVDGDEGWFPLDGKWGITAHQRGSWSVDRDLISIEGEEISSTQPKP